MTLKTNSSSDRTLLDNLAKQLAQSWLTGNMTPLMPFLTDNTCLISNQHGHQVGKESLVAALAQDTANAPLYGRSTNHYVAIEGDQAAASFYLFGHFQQHGQSQLVFGATLITRFARDHLSQSWHFSEIRIGVNWTNGDTSMVSHWHAPPGQRGWQMGDKVPEIVSELHSPWALFPHMPAPQNLYEALSELYYRYAFSVDQNDMGLLIKSYSEDIAGGFAPVGNLFGRDNVIGVLKSFRHLATLWQHFAEVVRYKEENDGIHVQLIVARIIPERPVDELGKVLYGAHYQLRARRESNGQWRFCWTDYRPGWFSEDNLPEFDIGNATA